MQNIFKFVIISFLYSAQAQDTMTVVAVGEAETEQDRIYFNYKLEDKSLNASQLKKIEEVKAIFKSDFDFYRSLFTLDDNKVSETRYLVDLELQKKGSSFSVSITNRDQVEKKQLLETTMALDFERVRESSHKMTNEVYKSITGKESIFLTKIYFVSDRTSKRKDMKKEVYVMDFDGSNKKRITYFNSVVISPSLSFDNSKMVYTLIENKVKKTLKGDGSVQNIKNLNLHLMDLVTKKTKVLSNIDGINSGAVFNRAGDSIYLTLSHQKNADIFKLNIASGKTKRITNHFSDDVDPYINANESLLTFLSGRAGKAMIYTLDPKGLERSVKRISFVGRFNASPRFNPIGTEIVFSSWLDNRFDIFRIGSDGKNLVRLTKNFGSNEEPSYSPDGQFIVFTSQRIISRKKATQDVYIMDRDGEVIRKITEGYGKIFTPRWSN